jgi:hypothetical protein
VKRISPKITMNIFTVFISVIFFLGLLWIPLLVFAPLLTLRMDGGRNYAGAIRSGLLILSYATLGLVMWFGDEMWAATQSWIFCAIMAGLGAGMAATVFWRQQRVGLPIGALLAAGCIIWHFLDLTPVKPFHRVFAAIHDGMTPSEVTALFQHEFPASGPYPVPAMAISDEERMLFFLQQTPKGFDDKGILVTLRDGKVVAKQHTSD